MDLNVTHHLLVCSDDINFQGKIINTTKRNTEAALDASKGAGLEVNTKKELSICLYLGTTLHDS
jgi:hypothetical protein